MRHHPISLALAFAATVVLLSTVFAQARPDFSGNWVLNRAASTLEGPTAAVQSGTLQIDHHDPLFVFDRMFVVNGMEYRASFRQTTDGREQEQAGPQPGMAGRSRLSWDGSALVLNVRIDTPAGEVHNDVTYRLGDGGRVLTATEDVTGPASHHNVWVYERR